MRYVWLVLLGFLLGCASAAQHETDALKKQLSQSVNTWQQMNQTGNYRYQVKFSSFTGFMSTTDIIVANNQVVERRYQSMLLQDMTTENWVETGAKLGSHSGAAPLKTLDALYQQCQEILDTKSKDDNYVVELKFDAKKVLKTCSYRHTACADDCSKGVFIQSLQQG